jgi:hypothetical protein
MSGPTFTEIKALIGQAEAELAEHKRRLRPEGRSPTPSSSFDQIGCLELWLAALRDQRDLLLRPGG